MENKPYCTCDELSSGRCGFCQGGEDRWSITDVLGDEIGTIEYVDEYFEDEEFDDADD